MILLISTCSEKLHELEFVNPVKEIVKENYLVKHYDDVCEKDLDNSEKVIICGTSLKDNKFLKDVEKFRWLKHFEKPVLGICAGSHIIKLVFGGEKKRIKEIGQIFIKFNKEFFGLSGVQKVYSLHQLFVNSREFEIFGSSERCDQAFKHKKKNIYGVLFHPEVFNKNLIRNFVEIKITK